MNGSDNEFFYFLAIAGDYLEIAESEFAKLDAETKSSYIPDTQGTRR